MPGRGAYIGGMTTRLYSHPIYLEHVTPPGHPERPDRLRAIARVLDGEEFSALDRKRYRIESLTAVIKCVDRR